MKREKISLFILVIEIALITLLHSARNQKPGEGKQIVDANASMAQAQTGVVLPPTSLSLIRFK
jgi:hypothetical protein